jgi:hypothetical protein
LWSADGSRILSTAVRARRKRMPQLKLLLFQVLTPIAVLWPGSSAVIAVYVVSYSALVQSGPWVAGLVDRR